MLYGHKKLVFKCLSIVSTEPIRYFIYSDPMINSVIMLLWEQLKWIWNFKLIMLTHCGLSEHQWRNWVSYNIATLKVLGKKKTESFDFGLCLVPCQNRNAVIFLFSHTYMQSFQKPMFLRLRNTEQQRNHLFYVK